MQRNCTVSWSRVVAWLVMSAGAVLLSGCFFAPLIGGVKDAGVTESDRQRLLPREVKRFTDGLFWGNPSVVYELVEEKSQETVANQMRVSEGKERVVESRIANIKYEKDAYIAEVDVRVRYYRIPVYVVEEREEKLLWAFSMGPGWRLTERTVKPVGLPTGHAG